MQNIPSRHQFRSYLLAKTSNPYKSLEILSDEFENKKLIKKLPSWLVKNWIEEVVKQSDFPGFECFAKFISDNAKISNHALWDGHLNHQIITSGKSFVKSGTSESTQHRSHALQSGVQNKFCDSGGSRVNQGFLQF